MAAGDRTYQGARDLKALTPLARVQAVPCKYARCHLLAVARIPPFIGEKLDAAKVAFRELRNIGHAWRKDASVALKMAEERLSRCPSRPMVITKTARLELGCTDRRAA